MPKLHLVKRNIDSEKHIPPVEKGQVDYFDDKLKGFILRVGKSSRTFYVQVDIKDPVTGKFRTVKEKIGAYGEYTPEQARALAPEIIRRLREGKPAVEAPKTLKEVYEHYLASKTLSPGTENQYKQYLPRLFEGWLELPVNLLGQALSPEVVIDRFNHIRENNGPAAANNSFKCLQAVIRHAEILYPQHVTSNPVRVLSHAKMWVKIEEREDYLEPKQFKVFADALLTSTDVHRDCYTFALYHGLRPSEAYSLKWSDVNFEKKIITFRHSTERTKRTYTAPMSQQSKTILSRLREAASEEQMYVFPAQHQRNTHGHLMLRSDDLKTRTGLNITVHGLRRTFIKTGERLRMRREDINSLTGHGDYSVTGKHYAKTTPDDLRPVLQAIANEIERLMQDGTGKVITFPVASNS